MRASFSKKIPPRIPKLPQQLPRAEQTRSGRADVLPIGGKPCDKTGAEKRYFECHTPFTPSNVKALINAGRTSRGRGRAAGCDGRPDRGCGDRSAGTRAALSA